jgi:DNA-binding NarL/FixJ family response regulator
MKRTIKRCRILLADDCIDVLEEVCSLLQSDFEIVGLARNGEQAVELALALNPDLVVLDISMPILNGLEIGALLRGLARGPKIIFLTVHEDADFIDAARSIGALGYVVKNRMATNLVPAIKTALKETQVHVAAR